MEDKFYIKHDRENDMIRVYRQSSNGTTVHINVTCPLINILNHAPFDTDEGLIEDMGYIEITESEFKTYLMDTLEALGVLIY
jgi:hypothetical protein